MGAHERAHTRTHAHTHTPLPKPAAPACPACHGDPDSGRVRGPYLSPLAPPFPASPSHPLVHSDGPHRPLICLKAPAGRQEPLFSLYRKKTGTEGIMPGLKSQKSPGSSQGPLPGLGLLAQPYLVPSPAHPAGKAG